jgi:NAD(P)-dependent dehydrogenase (short-subunit alcohol dehydrogenase family)
MSEFKDKKFFITGASKGIGFALAEFLDQCGASLLLHASSDEGMDRLKERFIPDSHKFWQADFFNPEVFESNLSSILDDFGSLDGFVNCVGVRMRRPINLLNVGIIQQTMTANFVSYMELVKIITKRNRFNGGLSIISISTISAHAGGAAVSVYAASKGAIESANRCLAKELYNKNIRVNSIICGQVGTEAYNDLMASNEKTTDLVLERQYMGLGLPKDVVNIIIFVLSKNSQFINGQSIPADGGYLT